MQRRLPFFSDAVADGAFELRAQREHGSEDFADGSQIVVGDPATEAQQLLIEHRRRIQHAENGLSLDRRLAIMYVDDDARHALLPKRYQHTPADDWRGVRRNTVSKD